VNCNNSSPAVFKTVDCKAQYSPKYDPDGIRETNNLDGPYTRKPVRKLIKQLTIFKPCKEYYYIGKYFSANGSLISESSIRLVATGKRWRQDSISQDEVVVQYINRDSDFSKFNSIQSYDPYKIDNFVETDTIGIVENNEQIWFHQLFRVNQFKITELAGPVEIDYPIELNDETKTSSVIKYARYMDIDSTSSNFNNTIWCENKVIGNSSIESKIGNLKNCWTYQSISESRLGTTNLRFQFQEDIGFVNFEYLGSKGEKIIIELERVR